MSYLDKRVMLELKEKLAPHIHDATSDSLSFSRRRTAARAALTVLLDSASDISHETNQSSGDGEARRGLIDRYMGSRGGVVNFGSSDDYDSSWAREFGLGGATANATVAAMVKQVSSPWTALVQIASILFHLDTLTMDTSRTGWETINNAASLIADDAIESMRFTTECWLDVDMEPVFAVPKSLNNTFDGMPKTNLQVLQSYMCNNFGAGLGAPARAATPAHEELDEAPPKNGSVGHNTSPIFLGTMPTTATTGTTTMEETMGTEENTADSAPTELETKSTEGGVKPSYGVMAASIADLNSGVLAGVEAMLSANGAKVTVNDIVNGLHEAGSSDVLIAKAEAEVATAQAQAETMRKKLAVASAPKPVKVAGSDELPEGEIVLKKAYDVFGVPKSGHKMFDFDVPVGEWATPHPHVPEIDDSYVIDTKILVTMLIAIAKGQVPWLKGHTGTGKTTMVEQIYARLNIPVYRVNLDSDISRGDLVGRETLKSDGKGGTITQFVEGIIPMAMQQPCCLLLDEIDASRPDLGFVLQRLTEMKGFMLLEDGGRTVTPHPWFRMCATANTNGRGDDTGLYGGTRALGVALLNRFSPFIDVGYMTKGEEVELIQAHVPAIAKGDAEMIGQYASEHRAAFINAGVTLPCSPRNTIALAVAFTDFGMFPPKKAWAMALEGYVLNGADADDRQTLLGFVNRVFPSTVSKELGK